MENPQPQRRDLHFPLDASRINDWHGRGAHVSQFFNTMSLYFPEGEKFFIQAVRHYRDRIQDPALQEAVTAFIGQEAMHGREHRVYNQLMQDAGLPAERIETFSLNRLKMAHKLFPPSMQLSMTIALEHLTAIMAAHLLRTPEVMGGSASAPDYVRLWRWHALEETEHKAVAYDVWQAVMKDKPRAYIERAAVQLVATSLFMLLVAVYTVRMSRTNPKARGLGQWRELASFLIGREGFLRRSFRPWLDYFKPGFHPWQHDNRHFLAEIDDFVREHGRLAAAA